jgi:hypothetical protein
MAQVFYAKDGSDPARISQGVHVEIETINKMIGKFETKYFKEPPPINKATNVTPYAEYRHVVIVVSNAETCEKFPMPGYYYVCELSPQECNRLLNLRTPLV